MAGGGQGSTAPGYAFQTLVRGAKPRHLRRLVGNGIVDALCGLDPSFESGERLAEVVVRLLDPWQALRRPEDRDEILGLLPLSKARELAERLGVEPGRDVFQAIRRASSSPEALPILFSFFGVVAEERAPGLLRPDAGKAEPRYALFDHQRKAAWRVAEALSEAPRKVVLHMPTGAGKTRTAMHIAAEHLRSAQNGVVCWLAQNAELLEQAADEFEKAWSFLGNRTVDVLRFWGQRDPDLLSTRDGFVVAGLQKMHAFSVRDPASVLRFADRVSLVVIDEAHQAIAPTYASVLTTLYTKRSRTGLLGLTATPGRTWSDIEEDRKLSEFFDEQKVTLEIEGYENPVDYLIAEGYLARPKFITLNHGSGLDLDQKDLASLADAIDVPDAVLDRLGADVQRNLRIVAEAERLATTHPRTIVFAPSVESARLIAAVLGARGHEAGVVTGETNAAERDRAVRRFRAAGERPMILCNFGVLTTGFDAPRTSAAIIARPTRSLVLYSQMVGRATRGPRAGGNAEAEIVTVVDPGLPGFGDVAEAFVNWEDVWRDGH